nr:MAG TPA: hypothetical protein [Caudoviricetes sp.]
MTLCIHSFSGELELERITMSPKNFLAALLRTRMLKL